MENYYDLLGVDGTCDYSGLKTAFNKLAKKYHPDMSSGDIERFRKIREAFDYLKDEKLRKDYDQRIKRRMAQEKEEEERSRLYSIDIETKIEIILAWSTEHPSFDVSFTNSCLNRLAAGNELTDKQLSSIENIIVRFKIDLNRWFDDNEREKHLQKYFKSCLKEDITPEEEDAFAAFRPN